MAKLVTVGHVPLELWKSARYVTNLSSMVVRYLKPWMTTRIAQSPIPSEGLEIKLIIIEACI